MAKVRRNEQAQWLAYDRLTTLYDHWGATVVGQEPIASALKPRTRDDEATTSPVPLFGDRDLLHGHSAGPAAVSPPIAPLAAPPPSGSYVGPVHASSASPTVVSQFGSTIPNGEQTVHLVPFTQVGLGDIGQDFLNDLAASSSLISYDPATDPNVLKFKTPSIAGYDLRANLHFNVGFGVDFVYKIDLGNLSTTAQITSSISGVDTYGLPTAGSDDAYSYNHDGRIDLFTDYVLDTNKTDIKITTIGTTATEKSYAALDLHYLYDIGISGLGVYDDGDYTGWGLGDSLYTGKQEDTKRIDLFEIDPNQAASQFGDGKGLSGFYAYPKLPTLEVTTGGLGQDGVNGLYQTGQASGTGADFAQVQVNPLSYIPVLGDINQGSYYFLQTPLLDVGVEWQLLQLQFGLRLALQQSLSVSVTSVDVQTNVQEKQNDGSYKIVDSDIGKVGDKLTMNFSSGAHFDTLINETYTVHATIKSSIDLSAFFDLDIGLLHLAAVINPIFIDEKKFGFDLWHNHDSFKIGAITLIDGMTINVDLQPITLTTHVDTFLPVDGTPGDDDLSLPPLQDGVDGKGGDDTINGNDVTNHINGGDGNDVVYGSGDFSTDGDNEIHGGNGWDDLNGGLGNDTIYADGGGTGAGSEELSGDEGNDTIYGNLFTNLIYGGVGDDYVYIPVSPSAYTIASGAAGTDRVALDFTWYNKAVSIDFSGWVGNTRTVGSVGAYGVSVGTFELFTAIGSTLNDGFTGTAGIDIFRGGKGNDNLSGNGGDDKLYGEDGSDKLSGGDGEDTILAGSGNDTVLGQSGDDLILGEDGDDTLNGGVGADRLFGAAGSDTLTDDPFDDTNDDLSGGDGDDTIFAGAGFDTLHGDAGNDVLRASTSGSDLYGDLGNDMLFANKNSAMDGGAGSDTYNLGVNAVGVYVFDSVSIDDPAEVFSGYATDRLVGIGLVAQDTSAPTGGYAIAWSGTLRFWHAQRDGDLSYGMYNSVSVPRGQSPQIAGAYSGIDVFSLTGTNARDSFVILGGLGGHNELRGMGGADILDGGRNTNDLLDGGDGDDTIVGESDDEIDGGAGFDTLYWYIGRGGETVAIGDGVSRTGTGTVGTGAQSLLNIEQLVMMNAGDGNDRISGGAYGDTLLGGGGDDVLTGFGGDDTIISGAGGDRVEGGTGNDTIDATDYTGTGAKFRYVTHPGTGPVREQIGLDLVYGGDGDDTIKATNTASVIDAGSGNDTVTILDGGNVGNFVTSVDLGEGNDSLNASAQAETIVAGFDLRLVPSAELARLQNEEPETYAKLISNDAGLDDDIVFAGGGDDTVWAGHGNDYVDGEDGRDTVHGGEGQDHLVGQRGDSLFGDWGDDTLQRTDNGVVPGRSPGTTFDGGDGVDLAVFDFSGYKTAIKFTLGADVTCGDGFHLLNVEQLKIALSDVSDIVTGGALGDVIAGGDGADTVHGGAGNDILYAYGALAIISPPANETGGDRLFGDDGDDVIMVEQAASVAGGDGVDTLIVLGMNAAVNNAVFASAKSGTFGSVAYSSVEKLVYYAQAAGPAVTVTGGVNNDVLSGSNGNDRLSGGGGRDDLSGGYGDDLLTAVNVSGGITNLNGGAGVDTGIVDMAASKANLRVLFGGGIFVPPDAVSRTDVVSFTDIERVIVTTGSGRDWIVGSGLNDTIKSGGGADIVSSGAGGDFVQLGDGNDTLDDFGIGPGVNYLYGEDGDDTIRTGGAIAYVSGGNGNDRITVDEAFTNTSADTPDGLDGGAGDDVIISKSLGNFSGGDGVDRIVTNLSLAGAVNLTLAIGGTTTIRSGWSMSGFEQYFLTLGAGNDALVADFGIHQLDGGAGQDTLTFRGLDAPEQYSLSFDANGGAVYTFDNGTVVRGFETLNFVYNAVSRTGTDGADVLTGGWGDDTLNGLGGNDTLDGQYGADTMTGGSGDDRYIVDSTGDQVIETIGGGVDTVATSIGLTLADNVENGEVQGSAGLTLIGNAGQNTLAGGAGADTLWGRDGPDVIYGNGGDDTIDGGAGADFMLGGAGNDTYFVDLAADIVKEDAAAGTDIVYAGLSYTLTAEVENLTLTFAAGAATGTGNALGNTLTGNLYANTLLGAAGFDTLVGGDGDDVLDGGADADSLTGGTGADRFVFKTVLEAKNDAVKDFTIDDTLDFSGIDAVSGNRTNDAFTWIGTNAFSGRAGELRLLGLGSGNYWIGGDVDGDGTGDFTIALHGDAPSIRDLVL